MALLPLVLSEKAENWRKDDPWSETGDSDSYQAVRRKVFERDDNTCQYCGFKSMKYQEISHKNADHKDNRPENLATACFLCHSVFHLKVSETLNGSVLIWLPEIPQFKLNHLVRTLLVAMEFAETMKLQPQRPGSPMNPNLNPRGEMPARDNAGMELSTDILNAVSEIYNKLRDREEHAENLIGTRSPIQLANIFSSMSDKDYARREEFTYGIRLFSRGKKIVNGVDIMKDIVNNWRESGGPYANLMPATWKNLLKNTL